MIKYEDIIKAAGEHYADFKGEKDIAATPFIQSDQVKALARALVDAVNNEFAQRNGMETNAKETVVTPPGSPVEVRTIEIPEALKEKIAKSFEENQ